MSQFSRGFNPLDPTGRRFNRNLGTDLRDPTAFLEQLAARKAVPTTPVAAKKPKQTTPEQPAKSATSTTTTGQDPRSGGPAPTPRPAAPAAPSDSMTAARAAYESELAAFAERERMGSPVDPLTRKRALQRYENNLGRIKAIQAQEGRKTAFWDQVRGKKAKREAANAKANQMAGEALASSTARLEQSMQTAQPVKSIDELNAEYTRKLGQDYAAQQAQDAAAASKVNAAGQNRTTQISGGADWLTKAIDRSVAALQEAARKTPTGQLSELAAPAAPAPAPAPTPAPAPAPAPAPVAVPPAPAAPVGSNQFTADYTGRVNRELDAIRAGQPSPFGAPPPSLVNPLAGMTLKMDPLELRASQIVSDRYKAMGVDPRNPNVTSRYMQDVDRELRNLTPGGQVGAPDVLPVGQSPGWGETMLTTLAGPGGLVGPPLPPELAQREIATAPTQAARSVAEARQATGAMQEPFLTLAGGGLFARGGSVPEMPVPTTRVIDNPMVAGASGPILRGPGVLNVNPSSPHAGRMMDVTPGKVGKPVTIVPGREGQIVDMPAPQAMPGVTPRDLPASRGGQRQGPLQPIAPAGTADEGFTAPTREVKNVPADIRNPAGQRRGESVGVTPASPTGKEQGPGTAAAEGQMRTRRSNARVRELRAQDRVTDILNTLADLGVLPARSATSSPEAKPAAPVEPALAEVAKPATPAPAPEAPIPLAEPTGTTVGRNTVQATTTTPRATPAPGQKARSRKSITEALKAYGTKVVEDTRALLKKDLKTGVTDADVLEYLKGLVPSKAGTAK